MNPFDLLDRLSNTYRPEHFELLFCHTRLGFISKDESTMCFPC